VEADQASTRLIDALTMLEQVVQDMTPEDAVRVLDEPSLQVFWRDWPEVSGWAGALWRNLNRDLGPPSRPSQDPDSEEVGGSG
jgi:hypothetical protein